jgi:hypothetical protein
VEISRSFSRLLEVVGNSLPALWRHREPRLGWDLRDRPEALFLFYEQSLIMVVIKYGFQLYSHVERSLKDDGVALQLRRFGTVLQLEHNYYASKAW